MTLELVSVLVLFLLLAGYAALQVRDLVAAAFLLGGYSYLLCLVWAEMGAVDVALTEAAVGAGISTALMLAAVHRTRRHAVPDVEQSPQLWIRTLAFLSVVPLAGVLIYGILVLPAFGDPTSASANHLALYFQTQTHHDTMVPNIVTAVLADYRGYDTMFETIVIFAAGVAVALLLRRPRRVRSQEVAR